MNLQNSFQIEVEDFNLEKTFNCGQTFRFFEIDRRYYYPYRNSIIKIENVNEKTFKFEIYGENLTKEEIINIFGLNHDIQKINREIIKIAPELKEAIEFSKGIRLIRMPPYETAISFIFSIQSQIPVIISRLNKLAEFGKRFIEVDNTVFYLFPKRDDILETPIGEIRSLKLGFREKFFLNLIKNYKEEDFEKLSHLPYEEKKKFLSSILGVGVKVSECIILFGYGDLSAFPVDTWIEKGLEKIFGVKGTTKRLTEFGRLTFGEFAGYAQQYIYYYVRSVMR